MAKRKKRTRNEGEHHDRYFNIDGSKWCGAAGGGQKAMLLVLLVTAEFRSLVYSLTEDQLWYVNVEVGGQSLVVRDRNRRLKA